MHLPRLRRPFSYVYTAFPILTVKLCLCVRYSCDNVNRVWQVAYFLPTSTLSIRHHEPQQPGTNSIIVYTDIVLTKYMMTYSKLAAW